MWMARTEKRKNQEVLHFWFKQLVDGGIIGWDGGETGLVKVHKKRYKNKDKM